MTLLTDRMVTPWLWSVPGSRWLARELQLCFELPSHVVCLLSQLRIAGKSMEEPRPSDNMELPSDMEGLVMEPCPVVVRLILV